MALMTKDMTNGQPMKLILGFSVPLLFGFLFQQFYSLVDTLIVGRYLGVDTLAAVGATGSVNFLVIGFCMGICTGFSIPVSHKFGAGDYAGMRKYVANAMWLSIAFAAVMTAATVTFCRQILTAMRTPENIIDNSHGYIVVIFAGIPVVFLYNILSGIIRALGDSRTPVIFLVCSSVLNVGLDLLFIVGFQSGVAGAAWATVISQAVSGVLCLLYIIRKFEILHITGEEWKVNGHMMASLCNMGIPMGLQYSITAIGSVILQSAVNTLGSNAVAAVTAAGKIGGFLACPFDAMGATMATYGGQNVGAGRLERIWLGMRSCILLGAGYSVIAFFGAFFWGESLASLFVSEGALQIIGDVRMYLVINTLFYFALALVNIIRFMIQGIGFPRFAILAGVFEMLARGLVGFVLVPIFGFRAACLGSPIAWIFADAFLIPAFLHVYRKLQKQLKQQEGAAIPAAGKKLTRHMAG
ncbi:Multidrug export protein MepA [Acetatifactor muris]|uniref:Multidrug export protein MepA n=2 Tax=Acetatifactor muris TaxID=879566 RepID=A0A2K4ZHE7_9FIRM|nr:Multidrug export protein MepA [Acetatifactor muris]